MRCSLCATGDDLRIGSLLGRSDIELYRFGVMRTNKLLPDSDQPIATF